MRSSISLSIAIVLGTCSNVLGEPPTKVPKAQPNVLWIIADDHAPYVMGAVNPLVRTPNLDRFASEGTRFDRAYCNSPVCTASRQSFLTGRYPRSLGVTQLSTPLPEGTTTLAHHFQKAGYSTASIGKMHFNSNLMHGFERRIDIPDFNKHLKQKGAKPLPKDIAVQPPWKPFKDHARIWLNSDVLPVAAVDEDMPDTWLASQAIDYLEAKRDKPFFLMVSFYEPHSPFRFPVEYRGRIDPAKMPIHKPGPDDDRQIPAIFRDLTDKEKQGIAAAYYTAVEHVDANVGRVLAALKKAGRDGDTIVVYIGDHGYMLGQHGRFEKHCMFEEAVRAPLIVRYPEVFPRGAKTDSLVEFVDIAPSLLELCHLPIPNEMQGKSFATMKQPATHRDHIVVEYAENEEAMLRTSRWKLMYGTGKRERQDGYTTGKPLPGRTVRLYDLDKDSGEMVNLAEKPEHAELVSILTRKLAEHMRRTARQPELLPKSDDIHELLAFCLQPRDVGKK